MFGSIFEWMDAPMGRTCVVLTPTNPKELFYDKSITGRVRPVIPFCLMIIKMFYDQIVKSCV